MMTSQRLANRDTVYLLAGKGAAAEGVAEWKVKGAGVVQLDKQTNTPFGKKYKFGKSRYLMGPAQHPKGILQRAFTDILTYAKAVRSYFCLFRVSYIEIYNERIEDLLTTTTTTTTPSLELVTDCGGRVVWCGAREVVITKLQEGHSEHVRRARRTKGRLEASHTVFRIIMESLPRYRDYSRWEEVSVAISFLDFVTVAGVELLPALGSITEELRGGPAVTQSLFTLHNFVVSECSNKSMLYDGRRTVLTRVLREALVGDSHSIFLCTCSLANTTHTLDTVRFGDAAAWLVQHPTRRLYLASLLHTTTAAILHSHQAARRLLCSKRTHGTAGSGLRKEQQEEQEEQDSRVRQELESEEEPVVARKRGRPRKYPVRFKPFGRECPTKIDYLALWKSRYLNSKDPRQERGRKQKREREEKFYMAGAFTLTTTSKRHSLRHLYKTGSLRTSDTSTYYGGYLKEGLKKKEEEERGVREEDEKENEEMEEEKEEEEDEGV
ncbi:hypothetical protein O3P69_004736 [Scylla paramamosain]|uniref:Kinesin motor domain-containing protein n=1 Tax=Scylla paramamosain TaxID=85552 RepID=A0AAW0UDB3_SCYPA